MFNRLKKTKDKEPAGERKLKSFIDSEAEGNQDNSDEY